MTSRPGVRVAHPAAVGPGRHALVLATQLALLAAIFAQTLSFQFVQFDDPEYVINNVMVRQGLTGPGLAWAFSSLYFGNWHPLTLVSHMLDVSLFGLQAGPALWHSALLHGISSLLVYFYLLRIGARWWLAALGSLIFLAHPLHVEPVAWVAGRKEVLCGLFYLAGLLAYDQYRRSASAAAYLAVLVCAGLALLAKPVAVTLPVVLLALDACLYRVGPRRALLEKAPLLLMSLAVGLATVAAQSEAGGMSGLDVHSLELRLANTAVNYATYLWQFFYPLRLAVFYPLVDQHPAWLLAISGLVLLGLVLLGAWGLRHCRLAAAGVALYLIALLPVIGLTQAGLHAHADRYMYLPLLGLLMVLAGLLELVPPPQQRLAGSAAVLFAGLCGVLSYWQTGYWENRGTLFTRVLAVSGPTYIAHLMLADEYRDRGEFDLARGHAQLAYQMEPERPYGLAAMGDIAVREGNLQDAEQYYLAAVSISRESPFMLNRIGELWVLQGREDQALELFRRAQAIQPVDYRSYRNLHRLEAADFPGQHQSGSGPDALQGHL